MGPSRTMRIGVLLFLTIIFFFLEIIAGYVAHSIALIADSFHMLSDIFSLIIAAYAIKLAKLTVYESKYTYGWQRAEVLGALINGVFLLALCFTILIQAIERIVEPLPIENPVLVLGVGSAGLLVNLLGLFLFHEHGHTHGHGHSHGSSHTLDHPNLAYPDPKVPEKNTSDLESGSGNDDPIAQIPIYPAKAKADIIQAAEATRESMDSDIQSEYESEIDESDMPAREKPLSPPKEETGTTSKSLHTENQTIPSLNRKKSTLSHNSHHSHSSQHLEHKKKPSGHLNMHGVFLHVFGDALGNVGVIISALIFMFGKGNWTVYADPICSIIITLVIIWSTIPLIKSASYILLQGVPHSVPIDRLRNEIAGIAGVIDIHEFHVWQLSDSKTIASVHILVDEPPSHPSLSSPPVYQSQLNNQDDEKNGKSESSTSSSMTTKTNTRSYMDIATHVKKLLHLYGIHSSTVQPEFVKRPDTSYAGTSTINKRQAKNGNVANDRDDAAENEKACLLMCEEDSCAQDVCCPIQSNGRSGIGNGASNKTSIKSIDSKSRQSSDNRPQNNNASNNNTNRSENSSGKK